VNSLLFYIYLLNAVVLINHEIDSAHWKEWELFRLPGRITGFLLLRFSLLAFVLYGLVQVREGTMAGLWCSLILAGGGVFAWSIHTWFIKRGREEFTTEISQLILRATLVLSLVQRVITGALLL